MAKTKLSTARQALEEIRGGPLCLGGAIAAVRERETLTQSACAKRLGISRQHLCEIEKGRTLVSPRLAAQYAQSLGHSEKQFVRLALQDQIRKAGLKYTISIDAA